MGGRQKIWAIRDCTRMGHAGEPAGKIAGPGAGRQVSSNNDFVNYFLSPGGGVMPGNGKAPNIALLWFCICSCICRNRFFDWSM